ncbi:MAG TPA: hypothetical protein VGP68_03550 [Gemmataceae bacterium]|jgi:hypothetical protein|nr:hypothetical protein [Gemmataceae bacterium]
MSSLAIALITFACMLGGALLGSLLRHLLPDHHIRDDSKDIVKTAAGMMATLVALIIGLLVSSAKSSFDQTSAGITQGGAKIITLDHVLARYGPEAKSVRELLYRVVDSGIERIWPTESGRKSDLAAAEQVAGMEEVYDKIRDFAPMNEGQQYLKSQALQLAADLMQSRWMLVEQSQNSLPTAFLAVLVFWLTVLFAALGLLAPPNLTVLSGLLICALSMACAVFLILELNRPLEGAIKVSSAPLRKALTFIGK